MEAKGGSSSRMTAAWNLEDADDPADWKDSFSFLREVDASLRCELCYNILTAPVAVRDCNHVFCSVCVRNAINQPDPHGKHCPKCMRKDVYDSSLIPQPVIETAALAWKKARPELMQKQRQEEKAAACSSMPSLSMSSPPPARSPSQSLTMRRPAKRQKRMDECSDTDGARESTGRVTRSASLQQARRSVEESIVVDSDSEEEDHRDRRGQDTIESAEQSKDYRAVQANDRFDCPLCSRNVTLTVLNQHLDKGCDSGESEPSARTSLGTNGGSSWFQRPGKTNSRPSNVPRIKLNRPNYHVMKDADVRKMLATFHLPTTGSRERMTERHRQWVTLYNANLDASEKVQKTDEQLRRDLTEWDRGQDDALRKQRTKAMTEEAARAHQHANGDHFRKLALQAKQSHLKNKAAHQHQTTTTTSTTTTKQPNGKERSSPYSVASSSPPFS